MNRTSLSAFWLASALLLPSTVGAGEIALREVASSWGVDAVHHTGASGRRYQVETMIGGVVVLDYDRDGDEDLFFPDGTSLPGYEGERGSSRLLRNEGPGRFVDVSAAAGIALDAYTSGGVAGDVDGDGDLDLYVTAFGDNLLLVNQGDGSFTTEPDAAGAQAPGWSSSAAFGDADRDGDLDLYIAGYLDYDIEANVECRDETTGHEVYCHPGTYPGGTDRFYRNEGGTFVEARRESGLTPQEEMAGLGVLFVDLDGDGAADIYVANDVEPNFFFRNRGDGTFEDRSILSGAAISDRGQVEASMGVAFGDLDGDERPDLVVTNFEMESNALYRNLGGALFIDNRYPARLAEPSRVPLGFGIVMIDLDHDRDLDIVVANGHVRDNAVLFNARSFYEQPNQVFENTGGGRLAEVVPTGIETVRVSRGMAAADLDGDGDLDVAVSNSNAPAEVYENLTAGGDWLQVDVESPAGGAVVGARASVEGSDWRQWREVFTGGSYQSHSATTVHFGLGGESIDSLTVSWPAGGRQRWLRVPANRRLRVVEAE